MTNQFKPSFDRPAGGRSPIQKVKWTMESWKGEENVYDQGTTQERKTMSIRFRFKDLDVMEATEPYLFPVAEIVIPYTDYSRSSGGTMWEALASSARKIFGGPLDIDALVGKPQIWAQEEYPLRRALTDEDGNPLYELLPDGTARVGRNGQPMQKWGDVPTPCWQILEVEGIESASKASGNTPEDRWDYLVKTADNLDEQAFYQKLIQEQKVTNNPDIINMITESTLVSNMIGTGRIWRDPQGVLHAGQEPAGVAI